MKFPNPHLWFFNLCGNTSINEDGSMNLLGIATGIGRADWRSMGTVYAVVGIYSTDRTAAYTGKLAIVSPDGHEWQLDTRNLGFNGEKVIGSTRFPLQPGDHASGLHWLRFYLDDVLLGEIPFLIEEDEFPEYLQ